MSDLFSDSVLYLLLAVGLGLLFVVTVRRSPRAGLITWLSIVAFIPIWVGVSFVVALPLVSVAGIATAVSLASRRLPRWALSDLLMIFLFISAMAPLLVGRLSLASAVGVVTVWATGFALGRLAPSQVGVGWLYGCVAVIFTVVAALAVFEFVSGWHGLASWGPSNAAHTLWGTIQGRGGLERSEGAFGHSIALGSSLAGAIVLTVAAPFASPVRLAMIATMVAGAAVTISRTGLLCTVLGIVLCMVLLRGPVDRRVRIGLGVIVVISSIVTIPFLSEVLDKAGTEASGSAEYRGNLLSLLPYIRILGTSDAMRRSVTGELAYGGFKSIDSQLILFGLSYGWMTLFWVLLLLGLAIVAVAGGRAHAPTIAVVAQIPALMTVALITQYAVFFWFLVGLAVAAQASGGPSTLSRTGERDQDRSIQLRRNLGR